MAACAATTSLEAQRYHVNSVLAHPVFTSHESFNGQWLVTPYWHQRDHAFAFFFFASTSLPDGYRACLITATLVALDGTSVPTVAFRKTCVVNEVSNYSALSLRGYTRGRDVISNNRDTHTHAHKRGSNMNGRIHFGITKVSSPPEVTHLASLISTHLFQSASFHPQPSEGKNRYRFSRLFSPARIISVIHTTPLHQWTALLVNRTHILPQKKDRLQAVD